MKVAIGQINSTVGDFQGNRNKIEEFSIQAEKKGCSIIVFPELAICGYPPNDLLNYPEFLDENTRTLRQLQKALPPNIAVAVGHVDKNYGGTGKPLRNLISVIYEGTIIHSQGKTLLPTYDVFDEARYFEPAKAHTLFSFFGKKIGIAICEDIWWEEDQEGGKHYLIDPVRELLDAGADFLLAPSASPFYAGKTSTRLSLLSRISTTASIPAVYANMAGGNDSLIFDGHSFIIDREGNCIHWGRGFTEDLIISDLDEKNPPVSVNPEKYEEIEQALILGIKDYLAKCGFHSVHLGLSGGIDSALVAYLAVQALGADSVTTFSMPSRYSSESSVKDAEQLAANLGTTLHQIPIEKPFSAFLEVLAPIFDGKNPDVTEENIQARIRGILLMAYSNKMGSLLLATGNKSELATGYCTLYGDMTGGLAVIGDLFKTEVFELCQYINRRGEIIPESIITKPPSAELRPNQKDEDSLPPYPILDTILQGYLIEHKSSDIIAEEGDIEIDLVLDILKLVSKAEFKRIQAPPVLKISPKAFGNGRRIPVARYTYEGEGHP